MDAPTTPIFSPARVVALALVALVVLGLTALRLTSGDEPVSVPAGAKAGDLVLEPCDYATEDGAYKADCGTLVVPENRHDADSRLIALPVTRIRAQSATTRPPVFYFEGGPGITNMEFPEASRFPDDRDVVLVGYRGVDGSVRLECPEAVAVREGSRDWLSAASLEADAAAFRACADRLRGEGIDLAGYSLPQRVDDIELARRKLGYGPVDLVSESFGTRVALIYAWRYPKSIHRSLMVGANPPGHFLWDAETTREQLDRYAALCAGWIGSVEPIVYRGWFWGLGHTLQYVNVVAMVVAWYGIAALALRAGPVNQKFTRIGFILYLVFTVPVLGHHFLVDPALSTEVKLVGGTLFGFALGVPSLMHGLAVMGGVEAALRKLGPASLFGWLRRIRWSNPGVAALTCSLLLFAIGGWSGTAQTTLQLNLISHNTMWIPGHLHGVVVGGTTLAFMGFAYFLVPLLVRRALWSRRMATVQAYLYGFGLLWMILAMSWAGTLGVPRRTAEISYGGDAPAGWETPMNLVGVGAALAGTAGLLFILNMVLTLVRGRRTDDPDLLVPSAVAA